VWLQVAHTHDTGDAYWSIQSQDCKGRQGRQGHDLTTPAALIESFKRSYEHLRGDVKLQSNAFVEATLDFVSVAETFMDEEFTLGGLLHNYITGTDTVNSQKFRESHAWRFQKDESGQVMMQYLDRQDFINGRRMNIENDWCTNDRVQILKLAPNVATQTAAIIDSFKALEPCGWWRVKNSDSQGWVAHSKSESDVLNYARRQQDRFSASDVTALEEYYDGVPATEEEFTASLDDLPTLSMDRVLTYCQNIDTVRAERASEIQERGVQMTLSGTGTVPNVRDATFTRPDRNRALRDVASLAEYNTTEPVSAGEFIIARVAHDDGDSDNYELPLSFGIVHAMTTEEGGPVEMSTTPTDKLLVGWFQPIKKVPGQKYGPGWWELMRNPDGNGDAPRDVRSEIMRGAVVIAGIVDVSRGGPLIGGAEKYASLYSAALRRGERTLVKCKFGMSLLRKIKQLPPAISNWAKYGMEKV
jgi:hypothetical protein